MHTHRIILGTPAEQDPNTRGIFETMSFQDKPTIWVTRAGDRLRPTFYRITILGKDEIIAEFWPDSDEFKNIKNRDQLKYWEGLLQYINNLFFKTSVCPI